jgi:hypothetical protein
VNGQSKVLSDFRAIIEDRMLKELWGYVKNIVYQVKINSLQHLKARIRYTVATGTPNMLQAM